MAAWIGVPAIKTPGSPSTADPSISPTTAVPHKRSTSDTLDNLPDFDTNNSIPSIAEINALDDYQVFDEDGRAVRFRELYAGENTARRILMIFVRHFFCGQCQEFLRTISGALTPTLLLGLKYPTFIVIIGCGQPSLIPMYRSTTKCAFPVYADPTKGLYRALNMGRTLGLGTRPSYQEKSLLSGMLQSIGQSLKQVRSGKIFEGGDYQQVGGEFLFEPAFWKGDTPGVVTPMAETGEDKQITWCHRMRSTRDHAELPELMEVLGVPEETLFHGTELSVVKENKPWKKRWDRALIERKGSALSAHSRADDNLNHAQSSKDNGNPDSGIDYGQKRPRSSASSEKLMGRRESPKLGPIPDDSEEEDEFGGA